MRRLAAVAAEATRRAAREELDPETIPPVLNVTRRDLFEQEEREAAAQRAEREARERERMPPPQAHQKPELRRNDRWQQ